jgi:hypothetical protein
MRQARSFTISSDILAEISDTKGSASTSERVNQLLRRGLELERKERLEQEAKEFFASQNDNSADERSAFQKASRRTLTRD